MDAAQAISLVLERIRADGRDHPTTGLKADRFDGGWCVYAPAVLADRDEPADQDDQDERWVFLVSGSGRVEELTSSAPAAEARRWFEEACVWFSAAEPPGQRPAATGLPPHPDLSGPPRPRTPAAHDRDAVDVLARALTNEHDFGGWLGDRLRELADLLGGGSRLTVRGPNSPSARLVRKLAEPDHAVDGPAEVWRTWPPVDPASLPDVDTTGYVLTPFATLCEYLEDLEAGTDAATPVADAVADRAREAPRWRACGVSELVPQLGALRRSEDLDAAVDRLLAAVPDAGEPLRSLLVPPGDADATAVLCLAVDAERHGRAVVDIDAATTAAYRRVLDRIDVPFETAWYEAMFE